MVTEAMAYLYQHEPHDYYGLSTDTKPLEDVPNGSKFFEMDASKVYLFDAHGKEWKEWTF